MAGLNLKIGINVLQATRELRSLAKSIGKIGVETKKANADAARLGKSFGGLGAAIASTTGLLVQATGALAVFGTGAAARSALQFTADFQLGLAEVNTLLAEGDVSIQQYEKQLLDLSTQSSKTLDDLTKGLYQTISAGIPAVEGNAGAFAVLAESQKAAVAGLTTTENAVDGIVSVLNAYGRESILAQDVSDKLFKTVKLGRVRFDELSRGLGRVAPVAAAAGVPLDDILAVLIQLTRQGVKPSEAITGLRNILRSIIRPAQKSVKSIDKLNIELAKAGQEQVKLGADFLRDNGLIGALKNLTEATGGSVSALSEIFPNVRALVPAIVSVGRNFEQTAGFQRQLTQSTGESQRAFKEIDAQFSETFSKLGSNIGRISAIASKGILDRLNKDLIEFNEYLSSASVQKFAKDSFEALESFVRGGISLFTDFKESIQSLAVVLVSLKIGSIFLSISTAISVATKSLFAFDAAVIKSRVAVVGLISSASSSAALASFAGTFRNIGTAALFAASGIAKLLSAGLLLASGLAGPFLLLTARSNQLVKAFKDIAKNSPDIETASKNIDKSIEGMGPTVNAVTDGIAAIGGRVGQIVGPITDAFGLTDGLAEKSARLVKQGFTSIAKDIALTKDEARRTQEATDDLKSSFERLASYRGFSTGSEMESFFDEINKGLRFDFSADSLVQGMEQVGPVAERLGEVIREGSVNALSALKEGLLTEDISQDLLDAGKESAVKFIEGFGSGTRGSIQTLEQFRTGLKNAIKVGTTLSEQQQSELARKITLNTLQSQLNALLEREAEVNGESAAYDEFAKNKRAEILNIDRQIAATSGERKKIQDDINKYLKNTAHFEGALKILRDKEVKARTEGLGVYDNQLAALKAQKDELVRQLTVEADSVVNNKQSLNIKRQQLQTAIALLKNESDRILKAKEIADEALKESKRKTRISKIKKAIADLDRLRLDLLRKIRETSLKIEEAALRALNIDKDRASFNQKQAEQRKSEAVKALSEMDTYYGLQEDINDELKKFNDAQDESIKSLEKQKALVSSVLFQTDKIVGLSKGDSAILNVEESQKYLKTLKDAEKVLGKTGRSAGISSLIKILEGRKTDLITKEAENKLREALFSAQRELSSLNNEIDKVTKSEEDAVKALIRNITSSSEYAFGVTRDALKRQNKEFIDSFESESDRAEFQAKIKFVAAETGLDIEDAIAGLRASIRARLADFGIEPESISKPLLDSINSLKVSLPQDINKAVNDSIVAFSQAVAGGSAKEIESAREGLETQIEALKSAFGNQKEADFFINKLKIDVIKAVGSTAEVAKNLIDAAYASAQLDKSFEKFSEEASKIPGKIFDSTFSAVGDLSFDFGKSISGALSGAASQLPGLFKAGSDLIDAKLRDKFFVNLNSESGFIRGVAGGIVGAANVFVSVVGNGVLTVANLFVKTIGDILTPIGTAIAAPVQRLIGSLGAAIGVLADTPEEEDRRDRKEALELQRATLAELQRSGASNEQIAQEQARLASLLRQQRGDEPQTAAERLEEEINRSVEAALRIAEQLGPLVETFFKTVTQKLPEVFPLLVKGLVEALDAFGEYFPTFFEILVQEVVDALPDIIAAIIRLIPRLIEALARGIFALIRGLPRILLGVFRGIAEAITTGILKSLASGISRIFEDLTTGETGKVTAGLTGGAAVGAGIGAVFGAPAVGAIAGAALGALAGAIFHDGGNVTSAMRNRSIASQYRAAGVQGFLDGGMVGDTLRRRFRASMSDDVPALLQTGEAVLNRSAVANIGGPNAVDAINSGAGIAPNLSVNVGINPNASGLGQAAAALLPFLIGSISVATPSQAVSGNLTGFRGVGGAPLIRRS